MFYIRAREFRNFFTYILGLVASEGKKNIDAINRSFMDSRDQSTLNRFLTASPWSIQRLESKRLTLARQSLPSTEGSTGARAAAASRGLGHPSGGEPGDPPQGSEDERD